MARIVLDRVGVEFPIYSPRSRSLRAALTSQLGNRLGGRLTREDNVVRVRALHDARGSEREDGWQSGAHHWTSSVAAMGAA